jgi:hypothetical protein
MEVMTIEGVVEHGQIRLPADVHLPDKTRVYIVVPGLCLEQRARIASPHLVHPERAADFALEIVEEPDRARL